jgi:hypothetical protein
MGIGTGVELEWAIVYHSIVKGGITPAELKKRNQAAQNKLQPYSGQVTVQAKSAVEKAHKIVGIEGLRGAKHSDEWTPAIRGNPEPKTDILFKNGSKVFKTSVKMRGAIQLQSGEGKSTADMFKRLGEEVYGDRISSNLSQIIDDLSKLPTRMGSERNIERLKNDPKLAKEFLTNGDIRKNLLYESWRENRRPELLDAILNFLEEDQNFKHALIKETMTGSLMFKNNKLAISEYILTPDYFKKIDNVYIRSKMADVKTDIRAKSRGGVTSIAMRIELKK